MCVCCPQLNKGSRSTEGVLVRTDCTDHTVSVAPYSTKAADQQKGCTDCTDHTVSIARYSTKAADQQQGCWCLLLGLEEGESGRWRVRWSRASARWRSSGRPGQGTAADTAARLHRAAPFSRQVRSCILAAPADISLILSCMTLVVPMCSPDLDMLTTPIINATAGLFKTRLLGKMSCQAVRGVQTVQTLNKHVTMLKHNAQTTN